VWVVDDYGDDATRTGGEVLEYSVKKSFEIYLGRRDATKGAATFEDLNPIMFGFKIASASSCRRHGADTVTHSATSSDVIK
jgi:hypothetical protein